MRYAIRFGRWRARTHGGTEPNFQILTLASRRKEPAPDAGRVRVAQVVLTVRLGTGWGVQRIAKELAAQGIGRAAEKVADEHELRRATLFRWRALWHVDAKGPIYLKGEGRVYVVGVLDDHSRFALAARFMRRKDPQVAADLVAEAVARCGKPRELMTDNGSQFVNRPHEPPSPLQKLCMELGIRLRPTARASPETNGKIEAFWKTFERELLDRWFFTCLAEAQAALDRMRDEYNYHRLHSGIKWTTPASRYMAQQSYDTGFAGNLDMEDLGDWLKQLKASAQARS